MNVSNISINASDIPANPCIPGYPCGGGHVLTFNQLMHEQVTGMAQQLSDKMFYISVFLLLYVLMNMYVFREGARLHSWFEKLYETEPILGNPLGAWIYEIVEDVALMGSLMLVILNVVYRLGANV